MESEKIGTFKQFLQEQSVKKINEARVSLEVDWWDEGIVEVMQIMKDECAGSLDYETLVNYVKGKFQILGRQGSAWWIKPQQKSSQGKMWKTFLLSMRAIR